MFVANGQHTRNSQVLKKARLVGHKHNRYFHPLTRNDKRSDEVFLSEAST
jgi:hypothetical protein